MTIIDQAIVYLAKRCDGAESLDGQGFNKSDADFGRNMALQIEGGVSLDHEQSRVALSMLTKYRNQLLEGGINLDDQVEVSSQELVEELTDEGKPEEPVVKAPPELTLSKQQEEVIQKILDWFLNGRDLVSREDEFRLGGFAGTGKTTIIKYIKYHQTLRAYAAVCAFTGKAVYVLQKKDIRATTMHALMYNVVPIGKGQIEFQLKEYLDPNPDLIIVDESSMVSGELYRHLKSFGKPILFVGDPGQLEPVGKDNPNLMRETDYTLTQIHRQAEQSPIIQFATKVRLGEMPNPRYTHQEGLIIKPKKLNASEAIEFDQIICATNKTRTALNEKIRAYKEFAPGGIVVGDKLMCQRNNTSYGVFNGMIFYVDKIKEDKADHWLCTVSDGVGNLKHNLPIWKLPFRVVLDKDTYVPREVIHCDYAYAITCHKSQGSEWDKVLVFDEWMPPKIWDMNRWRYTAITRAAKELTYLI